MSFHFQRVIFAFALTSLVGDISGRPIPNCKERDRPRSKPGHLIFSFDPGLGLFFRKSILYPSRQRSPCKTKSSSAFSEEHIVENNSTNLSEKHNKTMENTVHRRKRLVQSEDALIYNENKKRNAVPKEPWFGIFFKKKKMT